MKTARLHTSAKSSALDSMDFSQRQLRAINALLAGPASREAIDRFACASNGPAVIAELRARGLEIPCHRVRSVDADGNATYPGIYSLTFADRKKIGGNHA